MDYKFTGAEIRKSFIKFFESKGHTFVPSSSLVPGGDQTLLFTNAGMVQFKDVFLGTDKRPYTRATNSQKCMRVAGKHNDLEDVGRDDTHHTFFEMLGNWSFGDYYKKEAITWAWELLTEVWGIERNKLWVTCFKDEKGEIPTDDEAAGVWKQQPGIDPEHILFFGRKDNFWEMAETGPCGPCSEINLDRGPDACNKKNIPGHVCSVNGDCNRYVELWNLVFIQYNRIDSDHLSPLPATHVDTGMGFERIVSVLQNVDSNYATDLLSPLMDKIQELSGLSDDEREKNITPFRVITDHTRTAAFLIADGVVPGNLGRNYICRMIIRRASRFGKKIGLNDPFMAKVAEVVIENYGEAYPELLKNRQTILDSITREEERFQKTVEAGVYFLEDIFTEMKLKGENRVSGEKAFDLYATHGLPFEITRDIAQEQGFSVDEPGFRKAMDEHRLASGAGKAFGALGGEEASDYKQILDNLQAMKKISDQGVLYNPYGSTNIKTTLLALVVDGKPVLKAGVGDQVAVILAETNFYVESGGQVADTGKIISSNEPKWVIRVDDVRKPAAGVILHLGEVIQGMPEIDQPVFAVVDQQRRLDIMRNHTATHLLHAELHRVLGDHARQAGSLVAPDRLRFDFTHPNAISSTQLEEIEAGVNRAILENYPLNITVKPIAQAISEGAMALFGEKYGENVRTIAIGDEDIFSYELCGGTHVNETGIIGTFLITSEGSAAAGIRRIEAVTGRKAYELIQKRSRVLKDTANLFSVPSEEIYQKSRVLLDELEKEKKKEFLLRQEMVGHEFNQKLEKVSDINDIKVLSTVLENANPETLRMMTDRFRNKYPSGIVVLGSEYEGKPFLIASVTDDLVKRGYHAGEIVREAAKLIGGGGGGKPNLAQAGGKDPAKLNEAVQLAEKMIRAK
ncbi:MAG: alanine--tRNA ligase [Anaerolineaceae bacterium]